MRSKQKLNKHAGYATDLMHHHLGKKRVKVTPLTGGLSNDVFLAESGKEQLVIRMSDEPGKINLFLKEQWATARACEKGIPVPEILEVGNTIIPIAYMIARKIDGEDATNHPMRDTIIRELGMYAAEIHRIGTTGYGNEFDWSQNMLSKNQTWKEYLSRELRVDQRLKILTRHKMLPPKTLGKLKTIAKRIERLKEKPCLHHGDLRLKNVLVNKEGSIIAIIDWEDCVSSIKPYWDISIALHDLSIDKQGFFLEGYKMKADEIIEISPAVKLLNILNYAPEIERLYQAKEKEKLSQYRARLHGALDMFSI